MVATNVIISRNNLSKSNDVNDVMSMISCVSPAGYWLAVNDARLIGDSSWKYSDFVLFDDVGRSEVENILILLMITFIL